MMKALWFYLLVVTCIPSVAQEYVSPLQPAATGKAPGMKAKLVSTEGNCRTYVIVFATGDEVRSGLTDFAQKNNIQSAHFSAIGDVSSARVGFYDYGKKMFKVIPIDEPGEVVSMSGDVAIADGKPVVHTHVSVAVSDGTVKGGHLLSMIVGPTLEVFITLYPTALYKKTNPAFGASVIDPER